MIVINLNGLAVGPLVPTGQTQTGALDIRKVEPPPLVAVGFNMPQDVGIHVVVVIGKMTPNVLAFPKVQVAAADVAV